MDEKLQILLNSEKNINSVDVDNYLKLDIENKTGQIMEYDIRNALSATEIFDAEREANPIYRIYGRIEYLSLLNGLINNYNSVGNFFINANDTNVKTIFNSFKFYLLKAASSGYTQITGGSSTPIPDEIIVDEKFNNWVTSIPSNYPVGWTVNVGLNSYVEQAPTNRAKFVLDNQSFLNLAILTKDITPVYGDNIVIETKVDISPNLVIGTDLFTILLSNFDGVNNNILYSFNTLALSTGVKQYNCSISSILPLNRITILANSTNKSMYMDYFKIYKSNSGDTVTSGGYVRYFEVIATPSDFELYNAGFTNNVYGDQVYAFNFNKDFDITPYVDAFGFPATELYLYPQYQVGLNGNSPQIPEKMSGTSWGTNGVKHKVLFTSPLPALNIGDRVYGDLIEYSKSLFLQNQLTPQTYYISTPYKDGSAQKYLQWKYNPFIPFTLRYFNDALNNVNTGTTSYEQQITIPYYATLLGNGNFVWKDILPQGFIDPVRNQGVDYPFVNMRRYLFSPIILNISPDLNDANTFQVFSEIKFGPPTVLNKTPLGDINNIGKPCQ
jgi:hypothetical protein